jgi:hypothetical protein
MAGIRKHLFTPTVTFNWETSVPFVAKQGETLNLFAKDIVEKTTGGGVGGTGSSGAANTTPLIGASTDADSNSGSKFSFTDTMYLDQIQGIILTPYYVYQDTPPSWFDVAGSGELIEIIDSSKWKMSRWTLEKAVAAGTAWSNPLTLSGPPDSQDQYNRPFSVTFRHYKSPYPLNKPAELCLMFGFNPGQQVQPMIYYREGIGYLKIYDIASLASFESIDFDSDKYLLQTVSLTGRSTAGLGQGDIFGSNTISLVVFFAGNNLIISNGLPDSKGFFSEPLVIRPLIESDDDNINPIVKSGYPAGTGEGEYGQGADPNGDSVGGSAVSLRYYVGDVSIHVRHAQFDLAWVPIRFKPLGSFTYNTYIPPALSGLGSSQSPTADKEKYISRYMHLIKPGDSDILDTLYDEENSNTGEAYYSAALFGSTGRYTPVWYGITGHTDPTIINLKVPQMAETYLYSLNGTEYPDRKEYSVTMRNREGDWKELKGCYPVTLSFGWSVADIGGVFTSTETRHLTGFVQNISYQRDSRLSTVTLKLVDKRQILQDAWAENLPIYDGWWDTDVIEDLAIRGGITQADLVTANFSYDVATRRRLSRGKFKDVYWMFTEGTPLWDCMVRVARYSGCWLYLDNMGVLRYVHPSKVVNPYVKQGKTLANKYIFKEVQTVGNFNELRKLSYEKNFDNTFNRVVTMGVTPIYSNTLDVLVSMFPETPTAYKNVMADSSKEGFIPWNKTLLNRDPMMNTQRAVNAINYETYKRVGRPVYTTSWDTWGQPELFPLDIVQIREDIFGGGDHTVGADLDKFFIISAITHNLDAQTKNYTSTINADMFFNDWVYAFQY